MNSSSFSSIAELEEYKRNLSLSSETAFILYCHKIYANLLFRGMNSLGNKISKRKLSNDISNTSNFRNLLLQSKNTFYKLNNDYGINQKTFLEYMNLQEFIGERIFKYFNKSKNNLLNKTEFTNGLNNLYYGDISELIKLTFFLSDFNDDGKIYKYDMKLLLQYIPASSEVIQKIKIKQINKIINNFFEENIPGNDQEKEKEINLDIYTKFIKEYNEKAKLNNNIDGDLVNEYNNNGPFFYFISISSYLFQNCPFNIKNINYFLRPQPKKVKLILRNNERSHSTVRNLLMTTVRKQEKDESLDNMKQSIGFVTNLTKRNKYKLDAIPKIGQKKLFQSKRSTSQKNIAPEKTINKYNYLLKDQKDKVKNKEFIVAKQKEELKYTKIKKEINLFKKKLKNEQSYFSPLMPRNNLNDFSCSPLLNSFLNKNSTNEESINSNITSFKDTRYSLNTKLPSIGREKMTPLSVGFHFKKEEKDLKEISEFVLCNLSGSEDSQKNIENKNEDKKNDIIATYCYKASEDNNNIFNPKIINKYYAVLSEKEILFFNNDTKSELYDLWYVYKSHITIGRESINNTKYFCININYFNSDSVNKLYFTKETECQNFAKKIKKSINDLSFYDSYELLDKSGQGHFGKVCKCKHKLTNKYYAVKIIDKTEIKQNDLELIHREKSYLNLIKHPNIVGLKDYFEDKKFMYIITDYFSGGDLITLLENTQKISEKTAAKIVRKIAEGIKYLNIFGIVHRDIKPENIMFGDKNDIKSLKIIDLGVCQTLTYCQKANEPIGTNGYIPPEIYLHQEYSFKIDIWSLGIILYLLITHGILPFDHENMDSEVIAKKVIYLQQEYPDEYFGKCSKPLINLLDKMLDKNYEKRIDINELLKDNWFNIIKKQN